MRDSGKRDANRRIYWECMCDCGNTNIYLVDTSSLKLGRSQSCGCIQSRGEELLSKLFSQMNIEFIPQKTIDGCINPNSGYSLFFDFYLPEYDMYIEYDGEQHYKRTNYSHENFGDRVFRDDIKTNFCKDNGIKLIRLTFEDYDNIDEEFLWKVINE